MAAPKEKIYTDYGKKEIFKEYKKEFKGIINTKKVSEVLQDLNEAILSEIILHNLEFMVPYNLGTIKIVKHKPSIKLKEDGSLDVAKSKLSPDWKATKELWAKIYPGKTTKELKEIPNKKIVYHINKHTNGFQYHWKWIKNGRGFNNRTVYSFEETRWAKRKLTECLKDTELNIDFFDTAEIQNRWALKGKYKN
jgi:hypothetical protein